MPVHTKLATCSYCTARTLLKLTARDGHELACGSCGAPLHEMKWLKAPVSQPRTERGGPKVKPARAADWAKPRKSRKRRKRRIPSVKKIMEEVWDVVEDIFD